MALPTGRHRLALVLLAAACQAPRAAPPVVPGAARAHAEARDWLRREDDSARRGEARRLALRALELEPGWTPPQRLLDDLAREDLVAPAALDTHLDALEQSPWNARELYLAGRLLGSGGIELFDRARSSDPAFAWAHHGRAWAAFRALETDRAIETEERALALARDPWERSYFTSHLARFASAAGDWEAALEHLDARLAQDDVFDVDRAALRAQRALVLMRDAEGQEHVQEGYLEAAELIGEGELVAREVRDLATAMLQAPTGKGRSRRALEVEVLLARSPSRGSDAVRADLLAREGRPRLALELWRRSQASGGSGLPAGARGRRLLFAAGRYAEAVDHWLADLPQRVLAPDGGPREERLAAAVTRARAVRTADAPAQDLRDLSRALFEAGWFEEVRSVADALAEDDPSTALSLRAKASAAMTFLDDLEQLVLTAALGNPYGGLRRGGGPAPVKSLEDWSEALTPRVEAYRHSIRAPVASPSVLPTDSPRLSYEPMGSFIHPGPRFDAVDEERRRGVEGEPVPGLAALFRELGRFGIVGATAQGPDAAVLPVLWIERSGGELLGAPWSGTLVWGEGRDVRTRAERIGAQIAGAALHEGYWVDVETVRSALGRWNELGRDFFASAADRERAERALAVTGREVEPGGEAWKWTAPLGEADRVRLAVLWERWGAREADELPTATLDELLAIAETHEAAHLCDRARFLPIGRHPLRALAFFLTSGASVRGVMKRLEYRAQLTALCEVEDPRIVLADCVAAAAVREDALTTHGRAYGDLVEDFLALLWRLGAVEGEAFAAIDFGRVLVHQLHHLTPDEVRRVGLRLADDEGLVGLTELTERLAWASRLFVDVRRQTSVLRSGSGRGPRARCQVPGARPTTHDRTRLPEKRGQTETGASPLTNASASIHPTVQLPTRRALALLTAAAMAPPSAQTFAVQAQGAVQVPGPSFSSTCSECPTPISFLSVLKLRTRVTDGRAERFRFDGFQRLERWDFDLVPGAAPARRVDWTWDLADNPELVEDSLGAAVDASANALNQLTAYTPLYDSFTYSQRGEETLRTAPGSGSQPTDWDAMGRPYASTFEEGGVPFAIEWTYDGEDRLVRRWDAVRGETRYGYLSDELVESVHPSHTYAYVYGAYDEGPVARVETSSAAQEVTYLLNDAFGNVAALHGGGLVLEEYDYDPFGLPRSVADGSVVTSSAHGGELFFVGELYDEKLGRSHLGPRLYDPELGRFTSRDPLGEEAGFHLYAYARQNPLRFRDPSGLAAMENNSPADGVPGGPSEEARQTLLRRQGGVFTSDDALEVINLHLTEARNWEGIFYGDSLSGLPFEELDPHQMLGVLNDFLAQHEGDPDDTVQETLAWAKTGQTHLIGVLGMDAMAKVTDLPGTAVELGLTQLGVDETVAATVGQGAGLAAGGLALVRGGIRILGAKAARGGAQSAANAARLNRQLASREIAGGHAFGKHADEFADLGITTRDQFAGHIENIMNNPSAFRELRNGRSAFWDDATGTVVIRNPSAADGGTTFRPTNGRAYFDGLR